MGLFSAFAFLSLLLVASAAPDWSVENAKKQMSFAYSAYCNATALKNWDCYWCTQKGIDTPSMKVTHVFSEAKGANFGYAGYTKDQIVFAFRGTVVESIANWITDLDAKEAVPFEDKIPGAKVHHGFLKSYMTLRDDVLKAGQELTKKLGKGTPIVITGHSLGGALATIAAADIALHPKTGNNISLWTYGCPRVGNDVFANWINKYYVDSYRLVNRRDIVPSLPLRLEGYVHYNTEYWFDGKTPSDYTVCPLTEDPNCSDKLLIRIIPDHYYYLGYDQRSGHPHCF